MWGGHCGVVGVFEIQVPFLCIVSTLSKWHYFVEELLLNLPLLAFCGDFVYVCICITHVKLLCRLHNLWELLATTALLESENTAMPSTVPSSETLTLGDWSVICLLHLGLHSLQSLILLWCSVEDVLLIAARRSISDLD